ncbi:hypothetical protein [Patulibacter defluvii]|uniref:hypothetical protein n=1 Tax=Patulibacter defluvii TaxID=3095358 RepID=UPI002A748842|nr:hypothetical protein [Patulibacter sp. DM4]
MSPPRRFLLRRDDGQASVEHAALTGLVLLLLGGGAALGWAPALFNAVHSGVRRALCVASGARCAPFHRQPPCLVARDERTHEGGAGFLIFRIGSSESMVVERRSDGTVAITAYRDLEGGVGLSAGGRFGIGRRVAGDAELVDADAPRGGVGVRATASVEARLRGGWGDSWELPDRAAADDFLRRYVAWRRAQITGDDPVAARRGVEPPRVERVRIGVDGTLAGSVSGPLDLRASGTAVAGLHGEGTRDRRTGITTIGLALPVAVAGRLAGPLSLQLGGGLRVERTAMVVLDRDLRPRELRLAGRIDSGDGARRRDYQLRLDLTRPAAAAQLRALIAGLVAGRGPAAQRAAAALGRWAREDGWIDEREYRVGATVDGREVELGLGLRLAVHERDVREVSRLVAARTRPPGGVWDPRPDCLAISHISVYPPLHEGADLDA